MVRRWHGPLMVVAMFYGGAVACGTGCDREEAEAPEVADPQRTTHGEESPDEEFEESPDYEAVVERLCEDRDPCFERNRWEAGRVDGLDLVVFQLDAFEPLEFELSENQQPDEQSRCEPCEHWLVKFDGAEPVEETKVFSARQDVYHGAKGHSGFSIRVDDNELRFTRERAREYERRDTEVFQLSPVDVVEERSRVRWVQDINRFADAWDPTTGVGGAEWVAPRCSERTDQGDVDIPSEYGPYRYEYLPVVELPDEFRGDGWRHLDWGECGVRVDTRGNEDQMYGRGFVVYGESDEAGEASFRAVMGAPTELFVEIRNDEFVEEGDSWIYEDHLEVWTGSRPDERNFFDCLTPEEPVQWGIGLDGQIHVGHGEPDPEAIDVQVERIDRGGDGEVVRMRLEFDEEPEVMTLVYSDTDDGASQETMIATSDLEFGDAATLGRVREVDPDDGVCEVVDGGLEFQDRREASGLSIE